MTKVDFYIVRNGGADAAVLYACRLAEKAWLRGHGVRIVTRSAAETDAVSAALWAFRADSFLPNIRDTDKPLAGAVQYGEDPAAATSQFDVLVNLGRDIDSSFSRYKRVAEIVCQDSDWLTASRDRYRFYRDRGHPLERHEVSA